MTGDYVGSVDAAKAARAILPILLGRESAGLATLAVGVRRPLQCNATSGEQPMMRRRSTDR
jgi:hypothetical protein